MAFCYSTSLSSSLLPRQCLRQGSYHDLHGARLAAQLLPSNMVSLIPARSEAFDVICRAALQEDVRTGLPESFTDREAQTAESVLVIGAGIAGLAIAAALTKVNIPVTVLESSQQPRTEGSAIALWPNAFRALDALGVAEPLRRAHPLLQRIELCSSNGMQLRQFSLDECHGAPHEFRGVARSELLDALRSAVPSDAIQYGCPVASVSAHDEGAEVMLQDGQVIRARVVIGADGSRSCVAPAINLSTPNYAGYSAYRGVADIGSGAAALTPPDTVRQVLGQGVRAGLYPLSASQWYWFVCWNCAPEAASSQGEERKAHALSLVQDWADGSGVVQAIQYTPSEGITRSRIVDRWQLPGMGTAPGLITVAGDAAHPMTPNLGQGGCVAAEDAIILARELKSALETGNKSSASSQSLTAAPAKALADALQRYEKERSSRVLPITIRSFLMGSLLQIPLPVVCNVRNTLISKALPIASFMEHTLYDCGSL